MSTFNASDYIRSANEREQFTRDGKVVEPKAAMIVEVKPEIKPVVVNPVVEPADDADGDKHDADGHRISRSTRRLLRQLGEAEGRSKVLLELVQGGKLAAKPPVAADEDPEPQADKYTDMATFQADLAKWQARKETTKTLGEHEQMEAYRVQLRAMDAKAVEDKKLIPDYDAVAAASMEDGPEFIPDEHPNLMGLLATSDVKAFILYHFAKNPEDLEKMLELSKKPGDQIRMFARLEGRVEKLYGKEPEKAEVKKPESAADRDAKKARPSEAVAARGGSAPPGEVSPTLADGKTINPAWIQQRNDREGRRR